jgi:hypothetical protein
MSYEIKIAHTSRCSPSLIHNSSFITLNSYLFMSRLADYFKLGDVFRYFFRVFRKPDPTNPTSTNLRLMHGINRISIIMFLICIIVMIVRAILR